ncbi:N-acetyltransferase [Caulobacter sp. S45]|uniref:GNAT family N-acetyltransferase n=1 Tax=Caulobacter sp. S45 TaxID=1641861 RepID=UPI00131C25C8|nr:GNAT family N-acetyltransferase [Caulobacter sp. S45]
MALQIDPVGPDQTAAFGALWIPWLKSTVGVAPEPEDLRAMADPQTFYGESGGCALLARVDDVVVGAVAVKGLGAAGFEFCKLVVTERARGHGAGRALVVASLRFAEARGGPWLYLQSFNRLEVALSLYRRMGFVDAPAPEEMRVLGRTEIVMRKAAVRPPDAA